MIIERYVLREVTSPFFVTLGILLLTFTGYSSARYLGEAATGDLPLSSALALVGLKGVASLDAIVPMALFVSVALGLGRMHRDQEITALRAAGLGEGGILRAMCGLVLPVALAVGYLSVFVRPAMYAHAYRLEAEAERRFDIGRIPAGRFYSPPGTDLVLFATETNAASRMGVYTFGPDGDRRRVIHARAVVQQQDGSGERRLEFSGGNVYHLDPDSNRDGTLAFGALALRLKPALPVGADERRRAQNTDALLATGKRKETSEAQWRITAPLTVLLLGFLGVPVSRTAPRRSRQGRVLLALLSSTLYYNLLAVTQSAVDRGVISLWPGLLWVPALGTMGLLAWLRMGQRRIR